MRLSISEIKKLLKSWHFYKAAISSLEDGGELKQKLDAIEKSTAVLDDVSRAIIRMRYFENTEMDVVVKYVFLVRSAVYKRIDKALNEMAYFIANTVSG